MENVNRATNIPSLAREVVANCPIIDEDKLPELEQLLLYMQARKRTKEGAAGHLVHLRFHPFFFWPSLP